MNKYIIIPIYMMFTILVIGCGGGEDSGNENKLDSNASKSGVFKDNEVSGLSYVTASGSGITDSLGVFKYLSGELVSFYIGDILIGSAIGSDIITPIDLVDGTADVTHPTVTNITKFLITLDDDNDINNGILISENVRNLAVGKTINFSLSVVDFENSGEIQTLVSSLTSATSDRSKLSS